MATLQSVCQLTKVNRLDHFLAISLAIFLTIVTVDPVFADGGHGGAPISAAPNAQLGMQCIPHDAAERALAEKGLRLLASGASVGGALGALYTNPENGNWYWALRLDPGTTCIVASGQGWRPSNISAGEPS